ncbi:nuc-1 negative regulatory protein preg [Verticillium dahliae]|nr:nuc-1 negative regulatory protein preg [Verticillium dahliae]
MLTTSPRIHSSANASPSTFHYAPTRSSPQSPSSRLSASLTRRHSRSHSSTESLSSTSPTQQQQQQQQQQLPKPSQTQPQAQSPHSQPRRYVAVDAGTQYSPMEVSSVTAVQARRGDTTPPVNTPMPLSQTSATQQPEPAVALTSVARTQQPILNEPASQTSALRQASDNTLSPGKRRKSQDHGAHAQTDLSSIADTEAANAPKRQRPAPAPQKVLPLRYELGTTEDMVVLIAHMLSELIETNDALALQSGNLTRFHSRTAPSISVLEYLNRLAKHATLTPPLLLSMVAELKLLELEFLYRVDWKIVPNPEVLVAYYRGLVERCPGYALEGDDQAGSNTDDGPSKEEDDSSDISDDTDEEENNGSPGEDTPADGPPERNNA